MSPPQSAALVADQAAAHALFAVLASATREMAAAAYLDPKWRLLAMRHWPGAQDSVVLPVRRIAADAIGWRATGVLIAHNHPGGDPRPSEADRRLTRRLARGLGALDVALIDHLIFGGGTVVSLRALGLV